MKILEHSIVYKEKDRYASFPLLEKNESGKLKIGFFTAPQPDHCGLFWWNTMESLDEGKTWEAVNKEFTPANFLSSSPRETSDCYAIESKKSIIRTGSFGFELDSNNNQLLRSKHLYHIIIPRLNLNHKISIYELPDTDNVLTFPRFLHIQDEIECLDVILIPAYSLVAGGKLSRCLTWRSIDGGETFRLFNMFPDGINGNEMAFIRTEKGILAHIRSDNHPFLMESWSDDLGKTWSYPTIVRASNKIFSQKVTGGPPHLLRMNDNRIICTYGYRQSQPMGIRAIISEDEGVAWQGPHILCENGGFSSSLHKRRRFRKTPSPANDTGYPTSVRLEDESILTAYYLTGRDKITHIATMKWRA